MRRANNKVVGGVVLLAIILVAVGYAAITNVTLNINGTAKSGANQSNFVVEFIGTPTTGGKGTTTATINASKKTEGTVKVTGLTAKGDTATATFTVKNQSQDLSADLTAEATSSNEKYFETICTVEKTTLKAQEETTLTVTIKLLKTPIDETKEDLASNIGVSITAEPKQPGDEANAGSTTVTSKTKTSAGTYLPAGFSEVAGTNLDNGLTIQDSKENQYVWVEVPQTAEVYPTAGLNIKDFTTDEYTKIETDLHTYTSDYRKDGYKDEYTSKETTGLTSEQYYELKKKMLKSVYQNGGFYVGKYETGTEEKQTTGSAVEYKETQEPVIKQNVYPYTRVTRSQSQTLASNMEAGEYTSSLMFGVQWDLIMKYLETKGTAQADLKTDSTSWGNYYESLFSINANSKYVLSGPQKEWKRGPLEKKNKGEVLVTTGASDTFAKQGIYDLAGNVWEWTLECSDDNERPHVYRSGECWSQFSRTATDRKQADNYANPNSFRVTIF